MDLANRFESRATYRLIRLEYLVALGVSLYFFVAHVDEVRWVPAVALFLYIDLIGYIPGAIAYRLSLTKRISKVYYVLYNTMHSFVTHFIVVLLWIWMIGPEWALLAIPIHLCGDRAIFGNFLKPFSLAFEPAAHPAFVRLQAEMDRCSAQPAVAARVVTSRS